MKPTRVPPCDIHIMELASLVSFHVGQEESAPPHCCLGAAADAWSLQALFVASEPHQNQGHSQPNH